MADHSFISCWIHLVWSTKNRQKALLSETRIKLSEFLKEYSESKEIYMKINYVNSDHVHILIDLPSNMSVEYAAKTLKGGSSHWINKKRLTLNKFSWARGYGAFSVSESNVNKVARYIANQRSHHKKKTFKEEYDDFMDAYRNRKNR